MVQRTAVSRWKSLKLFTQVHFNIIIAAKHLLTWDIPAHLVPFDTFCLDNRSTMINISRTCDLLIRMFIHIYIYIYMHCFFTLACALTLITYSYATYCIHSEFLFLDAKSDQQQSWFQGPNGGRMFGRRASQKSYQSQSYSSETCSFASLIKTTLWWLTFWSDVPLTDRMTQVSWITTVSLMVLPWSYTWNLKIMVSKRNLLFQWFIFTFHVTLQGCKHLWLPILQIQYSYPCHDGSVDQWAGLFSLHHFPMAVESVKWIMTGGPTIKWLSWPISLDILMVYTPEN